MCLWSVLLPPEDRLLCSFKCFEKEGGAASVAHCSAGNTLVAGSAKGGQILVFSLTSMQLVKRIDTGKSARIHRLTYDPMADMLLCGAADGAFRVSRRRRRGPTGGRAGADAWCVEGACIWNMPLILRIALILHSCRFRVPLFSPGSVRPG